MKKRQFVHSFSLLLMLMVAIAFIFIYSNLKFTGFVTEGEETSTETTETTTTSETTAETPVEETPVEETPIEEETPVEETTTTEETPTETTTTEETTTTTESITVTTSCGDGTVQSPNSAGISEICDAGSSNGQVCTASYGGSCTYCSSDCQTLTVNGGSCGDGSCTLEESCTSCAADCGCTAAETSTTENSDSSEDEEESHVQVSVNAIKNVCTPNWQCGDWSECIDEKQERACLDINQCNSSEGMPETNQYCIVIIEETCFDGIMNQDEQNIDCGGVCEQKCSFLTMAGSVIGGQIEIGKEFVLKNMFGNITKMIISTSIFVLIIGGLAIVVFFWKKNTGLRALDRAIDNLSVE